ncbi:MAG: DUF1566 domain-containing protein [Campylobacterales bacterium]|nr:DUF1566 domain-containing protein [Campylobacterales bacterium]
MKKTILTLCLLSGFANADFVKNGDIVTDNTTNLQWQDSEDNTKIDHFSWKEALDYCEDLTFGGYSDWRLPNLNELLSLVDYSKSSPATDSIFTHIINDYYWSSSSAWGGGTFNSSSWRVNFQDGADGIEHKSYSNFVRCVRGGI